MGRLVQVVGLCAVVLFVAMGCAPLDALLGDSDGFDAERWRQAQQGCAPDNPRLGMYDELEDELLAEQPTRDEVLTLLGPPDAGAEPDFLRYQLGYNMIDCDFVAIEFGPDGRVSEVRYVQG